MATTKEGLLPYAKMCVQKYGTFTIEDRAIPDYRDGLIPVQRRSLWAAHRLGLANKLVKTVRLVGECLGKYHPHSDAAVLGSLRCMIQAPNSLFIGSGNWGNYDDPKAIAAQRYTELRMSDLAKAIFFTEYQVKALDLVPNFDGEEVEPVILHSNIPVVLTQGAIGIAVSTTCGIPSYSLRSVAKLSAQALGGKPVTAKQCMKLEFEFDWGGHIHPKHLEDGTLQDFYNTGSATLYFRSDYHLDGNKLVITGVAPNMNVVNAIAKTYDDECVTRYDDESELGAIRVVFTLKCPDDELESLAESVVELYWTSFMVMRVNTTTRTLTDEAVLGGSGELAVSFQPMPVYEIINSWADYRLELQRRMCDIEAGELKAYMEKQALNILAASNFDIVRKALLADDSDQYLAKALNIALEDARYILDKTLRSLKSTNVEQCKKRIAESKSRLKLLAQIKKNPAPTCIEALRVLTSI